MVIIDDLWVLSFMQMRTNDGGFSQFAVLEKIDEAKGNHNCGGCQRHANGTQAGDMLKAFMLVKDTCATDT